MFCGEVKVTRPPTLLATVTRLAVPLMPRMPVLVMVILPVEPDRLMPAPAVRLETTLVDKKAVFWNVPSRKVIPELAMVLLRKLMPLA